MPRSRQLVKGFDWGIPLYLGKYQLDGLPDQLRRIFILKVLPENWGGFVVGETPHFDEHQSVRPLREQYRHAEVYPS